MEGLNLGNGGRLRQTRFRQGGVEIFHAMVANRDDHQAGVALGFQVKFLIEDRKIDPFDRHGVEAHRRHAQQEIADVEIHLLRHPLIVIFQLFTVHIGKEGAALVVSGFCVRGGETAIGLFLIHHGSSHASSIAVFAQNTTTCEASRIFRSLNT